MAVSVGGKKTYGIIWRDVSDYLWETTGSQAISGWAITMLSMYPNRKDLQRETSKFFAEVKRWKWGQAKGGK